MVKKFAFLMVACCLVGIPLVGVADSANNSNGMDNFHYPTSGNQPQNSDNQATQDDQDTSTAIQGDDASSDSDADKLLDPKEDTD